MSEQESPERGWQYRLAVAFVAAAAAAATLALVPLLFSLASGWAELLIVYKFVFSPYGAAVVAAFAVAGFILSGERTANLFGFVWFTHPFWKRIGAWCEERPTLTIFLMLVLMVVGVWLFVPLR